MIAAAGVDLDTVEYDLGAAHYLETGEVLPGRMLDELRGFDAILLGAVGPAIGSTRGAAGHARAGPAAAAALRARPLHQSPPFNGVPGSIADGADFVVVRENTEGPYAGEGGFLRKGTPHEVATQGSVNTRMGVERCVRFAFELAGRRPTSTSPSCTRPTCSRSPATCGSGRSTRWRREYPDGRGRLQPRRRGVHLLRRPSRPLRRDRDRQPLRRHPHRPRRRRDRRHRARRVGQLEPGPHRARRCSSRCTAPRTTSPDRATPTRSRRSVPPR